MYYVVLHASPYLHVARIVQYSNMKVRAGMRDKVSTVHTVCALIFAWFIFRGFASFAVFAFLNSRLLGTVVCNIRGYTE